MKTTSLFRFLGIRFSKKQDPLAGTWRAHFEYNLGLSEQVAEAVIRKTRAAAVHAADLNGIRTIVSKVITERRLSAEQAIALAILAPDLFPRPTGRPPQPSSTPDASRAQYFFQQLDLSADDLPENRHAVA